MADSRITEARALLQPKVGSPNPWATLIAAALAASAAVLMAGVMVLGPGIRFESPEAQGAAIAAPGGTG